MEGSWQREGGALLVRRGAKKWSGGAAGVEEETARLEAAAEGGEAATFVVVPVQHNGAVQRRRTVAMLRIGAGGVSLQSGDPAADLVEVPFHADMQAGSPTAPFPPPPHHLRSAPSPDRRLATLRCPATRDRSPFYGTPCMCPAHQGERKSGRQA